MRQGLSISIYHRPPLFIAGSKSFRGDRLDSANSKTRMSENKPFGHSSIGIHCPIFLCDPPSFLRVLRVELFHPSLPSDETLQSCAPVFLSIDYWERPVTPGSKQEYRFILAMNQVLDISKRKEQRGELTRNAEDRRDKIAEWTGDRVKRRQDDDQENSSNHGWTRINTDETTLLKTSHTNTDPQCGAIAFWNPAFTQRLDERFLSDFSATSARRFSC
jgi:hypothetical protein